MQQQNHQMCNNKIIISFRRPHTLTIILIFFRDILHSAQAAHPLGGLPVLVVGTWCFHLIVLYDRHDSTTLSDSWSVLCVVCVLRLRHNLRWTGKGRKEKRECHEPNNSKSKARVACLSLALLCMSVSCTATAIVLSLLKEYGWVRKWGSRQCINSHNFTPLLSTLLNLVFS